MQHCVNKGLYGASNEKVNRNNKTEVEEAVCLIVSGSLEVYINPGDNLY